MSNSSDNDWNLDLDLQILPAWAQESPTVNRYTHYDGTEGDRPRRGKPRNRDRNDQRGDRARTGRNKDFSKGGPGAPGKNRREGDKPFRSGKPNRDRGDREPRKEIPLPELNVTLIPEPKGIESLARQIKFTGRAYPLFDIARLVLKKPERYHVRFEVIKNANGQAAQPLYVNKLDDSLWLNEQDAIQHLLKHSFDQFYKTERIEAEPPKGKFTCVAKCGLSDTILGPPNYHDYQNQLRRLHAERFSRMPFDAFKAKVKIIHDENVVKEWIDQQSWKTQYHPLQDPNAQPLESWAALEKHFRELHLPETIQSVESFTVTGSGCQQLSSPALQKLVRRTVEDQLRFPLKLVTVLSQQLASHTLQFFKVNKNITYVAVARPHYLDVETTAVSEGVHKIINYINQHPKCTRRDLIHAFAPAPAAEPTSTPEPDPAAEQAQTQDTSESSTTTSAPPLPETPTPEMTAIISDLHWLVHQGHVIEYSNGVLDTAKPPVPKTKPAAATPQPKEPKTESELPADSAQKTHAGFEPAKAQESAQPASTEASPESETAQPTLSAEPPETQEKQTLSEAGEHPSSNEAEQPAPDQKKEESASFYP